MIEQAVHQAGLEGVETVLRDELARGDARAETALPLLRHLVAAEDSVVFSDEILARVRGMSIDLATGMLNALADHGGGHVNSAPSESEIEALARAFLDRPVLLSHFHALALEWQLTERLQRRLVLDPVVSPLLQTLMSSEDGAIQGLAMRFLAAQARWCQSQRRMKLPLAELPAEFFDTVLSTLRAHVSNDPNRVEHAGRAETEWRRSYDEGATRFGLASRLVMSIDREMSTTLSVSQAGVALFLTALAFGSGQDRGTVVFSTHETQLARLALALRAAGLEPAQVEQQFLALHPEVTLPPGFDGITADNAAALLSSRRYSD